MLRRCLIAVCLTLPAATSFAGGYPLLRQPAPEFALRGLTGGNVRLSEHRGEVVVLAFWSSRCNPCRAQLAELDQVFSTYRPAGLLMLGINVDDDQGGARQFAAAQPVGFPMLLDPAKEVARSYRIDSLPMLVGIDRSGNVRFVRRASHQGEASRYVRSIRRLLDE